MSRFFLYYILPFLLPFIGFFGYHLLVTKAQPLLRHTPWFVLSIAGLGLVIVSLLSLALFGGSDAGGRYIPPHMEDGRIVPGRVVDDEDAVVESGGPGSAPGSVPDDRR